MSSFFLFSFSPLFFLFVFFSLHFFTLPHSFPYTKTLSYTNMEFFKNMAAEKLEKYAGRAADNDEGKITPRPPLARFALVVS